MTKGEYTRYLQTADWQNRRARRLKVAGCRCEFRPIVDERGHHECLGERCTATTDLQVHHLHYRSLGVEADRDLEVLCRFHHLVRHITNQECEYCGEIVQVDEGEAIERVEEAIGNRSASAVTLEDIAWDNVCDYCDEVLTKD